jgi:hypothetical protein
MKTEQLAHTHIQLLNQLIKAGYNSSGLNFVFDAYQYCIELCDGFQPCGKPFITHLIRTASILVELNQEVSIIVAGLLHSVYGFGDFGDGSRGIASWKQEVHNSSFKNSEFFSQMSSRFSFPFLLKKRIKGEVQKRTMGKVSSSPNN